MKGKTILLCVFAIFTLAAGVFFLIAPSIRAAQIQRRQEQDLQEFMSHGKRSAGRGEGSPEGPRNNNPFSSSRVSTDDPASSAMRSDVSVFHESEFQIDDSEIDYDRLYRDCIAYNARLTPENQRETIMDMNSVQQLDFDLRDYGLDSQLFAYISIPAIDLTLPIYLNVTYETLMDGAGRLSSTSIPIGGVNTNAVLAGHSGYAVPLFTGITKLNVSDDVDIITLWGKLKYRVTATGKIRPDELNAILIQEGKDMITLMTCTPVHVNSHRYLVFCERVPDA